MTNQQIEAKAPTVLPPNYVVGPGYPEYHYSGWSTRMLRSMKLKPEIIATNDQVIPAAIDLGYCLDRP